MSYSKKILFSAILFLLSGCVFKERPAAVHDFGAVRDDRTNVHFSQIKATDINVEAPKWLQDHRIRYRLLYVEPTQVRFYTMDRWIAPPPELMEQYLRGMQHPLKSMLQIKLLEFEQQFTSPSQAKVLMRFRAEVFTVDEQRQIDSKEFSLERWTMTPDAKGAVRGFSELIRQAANQVDAWLNALTKSSVDFSPPDVNTKAPDKKILPVP